MARSMLTHVRANAVSYVAADIAIAGEDFSTTAAPRGEASAMSDSRSRECGAAANVFQVVTESMAAGAADDIGFWVAVL